MSLVLKRDLKIKNSVFFTPTCTPTILYNDLEMNTAYVPIIGSVLTEDMSFLDRVQNFIFHYESRVFFKYFIWLQVQFWKKKHFDVPLDIFILIRLTYCNVLMEYIFLSNCSQIFIISELYFLVLQSLLNLVHSKTFQEVQKKCFFLARDYCKNN